MPQPQTTQPQPKLVFDNVFEQFKSFSTNLFGSVAEPRSVLLIVDWQVGQTDFPPGVLVSRQKAVQPGEILAVIGQLNKMNTRLMAVYQNALAAANADMMQQSERELQQQQAVLQDLRKEINALKEQRSREAANTPGGASDGPTAGS